MKTTGKIILGGIAGGLLSTGIMMYTTPKVEKKVIIQQNTPTSQSSPVALASTTINNGSALNVDFTVAAEKTVNAVVNITSHYYTPYRSVSIFGTYENGVREESATGSGVIISNNGYIVTNNHVIEGSDKVEITLNDERKYEGTVIGTDPGTDIALVKIKGQNLPYLEFGNSDNIEIGEWVLAVGNPFNLTSTVTAGIVSAKARNINLLRGDYDNGVFPLESFIQTDAAVNPGNSGGALVTSSGKLIGINTAIASRTGSYAGYSFAVPSNIVKKVTEDLLKYGMVQRAFLGVRLANINQDIANELELPDVKGVFISDVISNGAAKGAGIQANDVILQIGSKEVNDVPELQEQLGKFRPGDEVNLTIRRGNQIISKVVTLKNKDGNTNVLSKSENAEKFSALGATFSNISSKDKSSLKITGGAKIINLTRGKLLEAGLSKGFIITKIDKKPVGTAQEVMQILKNKKGGILIEGVYPNGLQAYFGFGI